MDARDKGKVESMICPKCRAEFEDWVKECSDCHVPLVETLPPEPKLEPVTLVEVFRGTWEEVNEVRALLDAYGIRHVVRSDFDPGLYRFTLRGLGDAWILVSDAEAERARELLEGNVTLEEDSDA